MIRHLLYLIATEAKNRLRRQAKRLRNPRYALALLVGLAYFFFAFGGPRALRGGDAGTIQGNAFIGTVRQIGPLLLAVYAALTWILGRSDALAFRPAEVNLLFTGPLRRRDLLRYKLLHGQVPLLFSVTFMTLISHGSGLPWWLRLPSFWVLFSILHLHHLGAALVHASAQQQGIVGWRRNWLPITIFGAAALIIVAAVNDAVAQARAAASTMQALTTITGALAEPLPAAVLTPFRLALAPLIATADRWLPAFAAALLVLLLHYAWVLRSNTVFEEAAAEAGERRARATQALRSGAGWRGYTRALQRSGGRAQKLVAPPFQLALSGAPAVAIVWKNLTFARRGTSLRSPVMIGVMVAVVVTFSSISGGSASDVLTQLGFMAVAFGAMMVLLGPIMIRNDLRMDLRQIEILRTMPLPPHQLVGAEIAASALTATFIQLALLGAGTVLLLLADAMPLTGSQLALAGVAALLLAPALATLGVTIQCAIALTFPAWVHLGPERAAGVEAMGQNILTMVGSLLLLALLLVLPALATVLGAAVLGAQWGPLAIPLGGVLGIATVYGEVYLTTRGLGRLFLRTDPSEVGLTR